MDILQADDKENNRGNNNSSNYAKEGDIIHTVDVSLNIPSIKKRNGTSTIIVIDISFKENYSNKGNSKIKERFKY